MNPIQPRANLSETRVSSAIGNGNAIRQIGSARLGPDWKQRGTAIRLGKSPKPNPPDWPSTTQVKESSLRKPELLADIDSCWIVVIPRKRADHDRRSDCCVQNVPSKSGSHGHRREARDVDNDAWTACACPTSPHTCLCAHGSQNAGSLDQAYCSWLHRGSFRADQRL